MKFATLLITSVWALGAHAHVKVPNLWNEMEAQKNWREATVEIEGLSGKIGAIVTDGKQVRLDNFGSQIKSSGKLESPVWGWFSGKERFKEDCSLQTGIIERVRAKQNKYTITFPTVPMKPGFVDVVYSDGSREKLRGPDNKSPLIGWFKVDIDLQGSASVLRTRLDLEALKAKLVGQLNGQKESILSTGAAALDLTSYDDVVCDMLNKHLAIRVTVNTTYSSARLTRTPLFKANEIERLYSDLAKRSGESESDADPRILMPAYLGISLTQINRDIDQLAAWEVQRLYGLMVDSSTGKIRQVPNARVKEIADLMDRLQAGNGWSNPVYNIELGE